MLTWKKEWTQKAFPSIIHVVLKMEEMLNCHPVTHMRVKEYLTLRETTVLY